MAIDIDKLFTVNEDSIKHSIDILVDQRLNFRPITREKFIELVKVDLREIPFDGTIKERTEFITEKAGDYLDELVENGKLKLLNIEEKEEQEEQEDEPALNNTPETTPKTEEESSEEPENE